MDQQFELTDPQGNAIEVGDERCLSITADYAIEIEYLQIDYERLVIIKSIG